MCIYNYLYRLGVRCFESAYVYVLLKDGFQFSNTNRNIKFAIDINGITHIHSYIHR